MSERSITERMSSLHGAIAAISDCVGNYNSPHLELEALWDACRRLLHSRRSEERDEARKAFDELGVRGAIDRARQEIGEDYGFDSLQYGIALAIRHDVDRITAVQFDNSPAGPLSRRAMRNVEALTESETK